MSDEQLRQLFEQYWRNRSDKGWNSQFEEKFDAAEAAFIAGYKLAEKTPAKPSCPRCGGEYTYFSGCNCGL